MRIQETHTLFALTADSHHDIGSHLTAVLAKIHMVPLLRWYAQAQR